MTKGKKRNPTISGTPPKTTRPKPSTNQGNSGSKK